MKKQSFTMRLFSILLCVAMLCTFAPLTSLAKVTEQVFVGGVEVTASNAADVLGDGTVSYDKYTNTLSLKGAGIYNTYDTDEGSYGIFATGDLKVVLENSVILDIYNATDKKHVAGIEVGGDLTVIGTGNFKCNVPPAADFAAGLVAGGALLVDMEISDPNLGAMMLYETVSINVAQAEESYAFFADTIDVPLGKIFMSYQAKTAVSNVKPTLKNIEITECYGESEGIEYYGTDILAGYAFVKEFHAYLANIPYVWVDGEQLTVKNMDDMFGDGTVYFDTERFELVFDNATITGVYDGIDDYIDAAGVFAGSDTLRLRLIGENTIDLRNVTDESAIAGICVDGGLSLFGNGNLTVYAGDAERASIGMYVSYLNNYGNGDLAIYSGKAEDETAGLVAQGMWFPGFGDAIFVADEASAEEGSSYGAVINELYANGSKFEEGVDHGLQFIGESRALKSLYDGLQVEIGYSEDAYIELCGKATDGTDLGERNEEGDNKLADAKYYFLQSAKGVTFDLWVAGEQVTTENASDVLGDGTVSFTLNDGYYTLTLNNATIDKVFDDGGLYSGIYCGIYCGDDCDLNIELIGDNVIDLTECSMPKADAIFGIFHNTMDADDLLISGNGSLTINVPAQADADCYGIYTNDDFFIYDETPTLTVTLPNEPNTFGIYCYSEMEIYSPNVSVVAGGVALNAYESLYVSGDNYATYLCSTEYNGEVEQNIKFFTNPEFRDTCKTVKTAANKASGGGYDLWVGGVQVNAANASDILGDGTVSYEGYDNSGNGYYVLTLNNATINSGLVFYDGDTYDAGIYCYLYDDLCIRLIGDNVINVTGDQATYAMGIFSYYDTRIEGEGTLTVNVVGSEDNYAAYGINADWDSETVELYAGDITVNVSGDAEDTTGIRAYSFYDDNKGKVDVTVNGPEYVYGLCSSNVYLRSLADFSVTATYTSTNDPEAYALYRCYYLSDSPVSRGATFAGQTQAVSGYLYGVNVNTLTMSAYTDLAGTAENKVESPSWSNRSDYKTIVLSRGTKTVTPILTKTLAECEWWDDYAGQTVGNDEQVTIGWDVGEEEISRVIVYADIYDKGEYSELANLNVGNDPTITSYSRYAYSNGYDLSGKTCSWVLGVQFTDGTMATSDPFDVTYYCVYEHDEIMASPWIPEIGMTADEMFPGLESNVGYFADKQNATWYLVEDGEKTELAPDDVFLPGKQYALHVESLFGESFTLKEEALKLSLEGDGFVEEECTASYDKAAKTLSIDVLYEPLKTYLLDVYVDYEELSSTMTPADFLCTVSGASRSSSPSFALPIADGKITTAWTCCESDIYDEESAVEIENDENFVPGYTYQCKVSFLLNDRFAVANDTRYMGNMTEYPMMLDGAYDAATGMVTVTLPVMGVYDYIKEFNMFVTEPEAGLTPDHITAFGDSNVNDYISSITIRWYELDDTGTSVGGPMDSAEQFKAGTTYGMSMEVILDGSFTCFWSPDVPVTLNAAEPEYSDLSDPITAEIGQRFTIAEDVTPLDALDFTVSSVTAGDTPADVTVSFDEDLVAFVTTRGFVYEGTGDPATDLEGYEEMASTDVFEYGKTYAIEVDYSLKSGAENGEEMVLTVNGEEPLVADPDGRKGGWVVMTFTLEEPTLTLSADTTELTLGDEALAAVSFGLEYGFEATNRVLVDVVDANGDDALCGAFDAGVESFTLDMSDFEVGTYTVTATAYDGKNAIVSNSVDVVVKPQPTTTESTTATATETEPTATATETEPTATATETEPTATATETEPTATATGTQADEILYGDANGDGEVNMKDVLTLRKHLAGIEIMLHPLNSDANGDGEINMKDVLMIRKYMANLITELGPTA